MYELITTYGIYGLTMLLAGLGWLLARFILVLIDNILIRGYVAAAWEEVKAAVLEVGQTYVGALKKANADGKLTYEEKAIAKRRAIDIAKANLGSKGLKRLARIFDVEKWFANKVEAAVATLPKAIALPPKPQASPE